MAPVTLPLELPLQLTPQQRRGYERLAMTIVERNLVELEDHLTRASQQLPIDQQRWKLFKSREAIDIYQSKDPFHTDIFTHPYRHDRIGLEQSSRPRIELSKLLCVGTLQGTVESVMLGSATPTKLSMAARSLYIQDEFIQHEVLHDIRRPTAAEPFEYVGLKWALRASPIASIVSPRDLVYVEATGFRALSRRDRGHEQIGYVVYHSFDLAALPPLAEKGVTRAKYSLCIFCRQAGPGVVEIYATLLSDPGGHLPLKLAAQSAASALVAVSKAMDCAIARTLVWLLNRRPEAGDTPRHQKTVSSYFNSTRGKRCCGQCARELASYRKRSKCCLCLTPVCSRCVKTKRLALGASAADLTLIPLSVCTGCITTARRLNNAAQVAMDEAGELYQERASSVWLMELGDHGCNGPTTSVHSPTVTGEASALRIQCSTYDTGGTVSFEDDWDETDGAVGSQYGSQASTPHSWVSRSQPQSPLDSERTRMLQMMQSLRLQAEQTYSTTVSLSVSSTSSSRFEVVSE